jgi:hypothetical protein
LSGVTPPIFAASPQFLILEDVVPKADLAQMVEVGTRWHTLAQEELPLPLNRTGVPSPGR